MPIEQIAKEVYNTVRYYNNKDMKIYSSEQIWRSFQGKYTKQEIGYAIQVLRNNKKITYTKRYGWIIY